MAEWLFERAAMWRLYCLFCCNERRSFWERILIPDSSLWFLRLCFQRGLVDHSRTRVYANIGAVKNSVLHLGTKQGHWISKARPDMYCREVIPDRLRDPEGIRLV